MSIKAHKQFFIPKSGFLAYYSYFCLSNMLGRTFFLQRRNKPMREVAKCQVTYLLPRRA
ncbi:hypothetical protein HMPREF0670_00899 [Prevotella sp. oral taxon 317 str. F0108]|nr:hypothetical protein HMPREF0670_00899 [Prevotella sp. oral taxon 317 str. F0108]